MYSSLIRFTRALEREVASSVCSFHFTCFVRSCVSPNNKYVWLARDRIVTHKKAIVFADFVSINPKNVKFKEAKAYKSFVQYNEVKIVFFELIF